MLDGAVRARGLGGQPRRASAPGDVQWMTAGAASSTPRCRRRDIREQGGRMHGFQIWVNLPARDKMMAPRYQELPAARIPEATSPRRARQRARDRGRVARRAGGDRHAHADPLPGLDARAGRRVEQPLAAGHDALVYVFEGSAESAPTPRVPRRAARPPRARATRVRLVGAGGRDGRRGCSCCSRASRSRAGRALRAVRDEHAGRDHGRDLDYQTGRMGHIER